MTLYPTNIPVEFSQNEVIQVRYPPISNSLSSLTVRLVRVFYCQENLLYHTRMLEIAKLQCFVKIFPINWCVKIEITFGIIYVQTEMPFQFRI